MAKKRSTKKTTKKVAKATAKKAAKREKSTQKATKKAAKKNAEGTTKPGSMERGDWRAAQSVLNLGLTGHVDSGKTSLTQSLSGEWTDRHSQEKKRGISIKLGYADTVIMKCPTCEEPQAYTTLVLANAKRPEGRKEGTCPHCGSELQFVRKISFVDAPGHEILMATMLSGAALMDGACLLVAADEFCPQPQTREHLAALQITGVEKIIIVQNKIDRVTRERAVESYREILKFVKGTVAEGAPIIPVSAVFGANVDVLIQKIEELMPTPERDPDKPMKFYVARSFDVNKPGTKPADLMGGVIGGSVIEGVVRVGDEIEIKPGYREQDGTFKTLRTRVESISSGVGVDLEEGYPGGLLGIRTSLDPALTKGDSLRGHVAGAVGTLPEVRDTVTFKAELLPRVIGAEEVVTVTPIRLKEPLMLIVGTAITLGVVVKLGKGNRVTLKLSQPVCVTPGESVAISRQVENHYRLIGHGVLL
ncbi:MAG: translation initiation factor IF-2 subunit gamma [Promethearchaeota archaeon]